MPNYTDLTVSSGELVKVRPRTYEEWERQEQDRLEKIAGLPDMAKGGHVTELDLALQRANLEVRDARLQVWVKDFAKVRSVLTMRDIAEIEKAVQDMEQVEVPLGNSETGGDGP